MKKRLRFLCILLLFLSAVSVALFASAPAALRLSRDWEIRYRDRSGPQSRIMPYGKIEQFVRDADIRDFSLLYDGLDKESLGYGETYLFSDWSFSNVKIYLNETLLAQFKRKSVFKEPYYVYIPPDLIRQNNRLRLEFQSQGFFRIAEEIRIGGSNLLEEYRQVYFIKVTWNQVIVVCSLIFAFFYLILFINMPSVRLYLYFAVLLVSYGLYNSFYCVNLPFANFTLHGQLALFGAWVAIYAFYRSIMRYFNLQYPLMDRICLALFSFQMLCVLLIGGEASRFVFFRSLGNLTGLVIVVITFVLLFTAIRTNVRRYWMPLFLFTVPVVSSIYDLIFILRKKAYAPSIGFVLPLAIIGISLYWINDLVVAYRENVKNKKALEILNENLEHKVKERTSELFRERNLLKERNLTIEKDLGMARRIQMQLMPDESPVENIANFYKPMDLVGGDFYDYIHFREADKIGIFISDVSGHGVPAAFITLMIKSFIQESGALKYEPTSLLWYLNSMLFGQTADHFVTAFYGIIDREERSILYSNAGHNPPMVITPAGSCLLGTSHGPPLAAFCNEEIRERKREYISVTHHLSEGDKILFYTDGLVEAVNRHNPAGDYETLRFRERIDEIRHLPPGPLLKGLYEDLIRFRGSDDFDDDICIVCMSMDFNPGGTRRFG